MNYVIRPINTHQRMLNNILAYFSTKTFSKNEAEKIVGGEKRLIELIISGAIEADKPTAAQNGKWRCNAAQVLEHCACKLPRRRKKSNR